MLRAWESGIGQGLVQRGLTLLALADPAASPQSLAALSIGERDRRLLALREACFGCRMTGLVSCVGCHDELEIELDTATLRLPSPSLASDVSLTGDSYRLRLRLPDSHDLQACAGVNPEDGVRLLIRACIVDAVVDDQRIVPDAAPAQVLAAAAARLAELDPLADLRLQFACVNCGQRWEVPFDIVPFFWAELDDWAGRTLREVHTLATAYGWTEHEVLSLGTVRRQHYLRLVDDA